MAPRVLTDDVLHFAPVGLVEFDFHGLEGDAFLLNTPVPFAEDDFTDSDGIAVLGRRRRDHVGRDNGAADKILACANLQFEALPDLGVGEDGVGRGWVDGCRVGDVVSWYHFGEIGIETVLILWSM